MSGKRVAGALCYSKKVNTANNIITGVVTACCALGFFCTDKDITPLIALAGFAWAETAASNAFYFWKARHENRIKLTKQMVTDLADKYGIDAVVSLAGLVIKD